MARPDKAAAVAELDGGVPHARPPPCSPSTAGSPCRSSRSCGARSASNATYAVVKNTLTKIAAREAGVDGFDDLLAGPVGDRVRQRRPGRGGQGPARLRQGEPAARHQGRRARRQAADRRRDHASSPTSSRARCCSPSSPARCRRRCPTPCRCSPRRWPRRSPARCPEASCASGRAGRLGTRRRQRAAPRCDAPAAAASPRLAEAEAPAGRGGRRARGCSRARPRLRRGTAEPVRGARTGGDRGDHRGLSAHG